MRNGDDRLVHACCSLSSSVKLFMFMVPLVVVPGAIFFLGPNRATSSIFSSSLWSWSSARGDVSQARLNGDVLDQVPVRSGSVSATVQETMNGSVSVLPGGFGVGRFASTPSPSPSPSPAPPPEMSPLQDDIPENASEFLLNAGDRVNSNPPINDSLARPKRVKQRGTKTSIQKLEAGLRRARSAIRATKNGNRSSDPEYVPVGPMYRNANNFHRSYLEMEKQFKVFIYREGEHPVFHNGPCKSIYSMEGNFIHMIEINRQFRTRNPEKAHVFFLPFSVTMMVRYVYVRDSHDFSPIRHTVVDYINVLAEKYPYWNRSLAADHFMLACHDWGPEASFSVPYLYKNSIRVLCNANTSEGFNPSKDVSFPEVNLRTGDIRGFVGGPSPSHRPVLAFFAGGLHGPIRPILLEHWENKDEDMKIHRYLPRGVSYYDMLRKSKFCICPSGYEVASPRVVEAIYTGCVPVLISNHYVPPFSDVLNWNSFSVVVPVRDIPNLKRILTSISPRHYIRMQRRVKQVRRHFEVNSPPKRYDVFHMILHSVWLRRLNVRVHDEES